MYPFGARVSERAASRAGGSVCRPYGGQRTVRGNGGRPQGSPLRYSQSVPDGRVLDPPLRRTTDRSGERRAAARVAPTVLPTRPYSECRNGCLLLVGDPDRPTAPESSRRGPHSRTHPHPPQCAHWGTFPLIGGRLFCTGSVGPAKAGAEVEPHRTQILQTQGPSGPGRNRTQALLVLRAGRTAQRPRDNPRNGVRGKVNMSASALI